MKFDLGDLLGLAFLFFFVILPAIQSFTRRRPPVDMPDEVEYNLPDKSKGETNLPRPPSDSPPPGQRPVAQQTQPTPQRPQPMPQRPQPARPPAPRQPASPAPQPRPMVSEPNKPKPVQRGKTLEQLENERLNRQPVVHEAFTPPPAPAAVVEVGEIRRPQSKPLATDSNAILNGMIWQQVLGEPRGRHWSKMRRSK